MKKGIAMILDDQPSTLLSLWAFIMSGQSVLALFFKETGKDHALINSMLQLTNQVFDKKDLYVKFVNLTKETERINSTLLSDIPSTPVTENDVKQIVGGILSVATMHPLMDTRDMANYRLTVPKGRKNADGLHNSKRLDVHESLHSTYEGLSKCMSPETKVENDKLFKKIMGKLRDKTNSGLSVGERVFSYADLESAIEKYDFLAQSTISARMEVKLTDDDVSVFKALEGR